MSSPTHPEPALPLESPVASSSSGDSRSIPAAEASERFWAMDSLRAAAMLLGVYFHAVVFDGLGSLNSKAMMFTDWSHNFRMQLFFAVSGFFSCMMFLRYGWGRYFFKRWWRIAVPLAVAVYAFAVLRVAIGPLFPVGGFASFWMNLTKKKPFLERLPVEINNWLMLGHLWFLWYLLVFASVLPFLIQAGLWLSRLPLKEKWDRVCRVSIQFHLVPLIIGVFTAPTLMRLFNLAGWKLPPAKGVMARFPEGLWYYSDFPLFFAYFLAGAWLFSMRSYLPLLARQWWSNGILAAGLYIAATKMGNKYAFMADHQDYYVLRYYGYLLLSLSASYTVFAFISLFQKFANRNWVITRYFAETAFWIYLIHIELLVPIIKRLNTFQLSWWSKAIASSVLATAAALILFELFVRWTPLRSLFGSPRKKKKKEPREESAMKATQRGECVVN